jgi:hypothetical protein
MKFFARVTDHCWCCNRVLHMSENGLAYANLRISEGRGVRPFLCNICSKLTWDEMPGPVEKAA